MLNVMNANAGGNVQPEPNALRELETILREAGMDRLYGFESDGIGVLSVTQCLTIWYRDRRLIWTQGSMERSWPVTDVAGAAEAILDAVKVSA